MEQNNLTFLPYLTFLYIDTVSGEKKLSQANRCDFRVILCSRRLFSSLKMFLRETKFDDIK